MAGYIFSLDNIESLHNCIKSGVYSTNFKKLEKNFWRVNHEGTFADYLSMKPRDNVYFFIKRKIYGIGQLINVGFDCKYLNYPNATIPKKFNFEDIQESMLLCKDENLNNRCICTFKPMPNFFEQGIDMDDVLASNPIKFRMLRAFWKLSFIKIDDEENKALKDIILKRNEKFILKG